MIKNISLNNPITNTSLKPNTTTNSSSTGNTLGGLNNFNLGTNTGFNFNSNWGKNGLFNTNTNAPLIQENSILSEIQQQSKEKTDLKQALKIIVDLYTLANEYGKKIKPLEGAEAFEKKLCGLEEDTNRAIMHTLMALAREIDHGNAFITEYRHRLDTYTSDETTKSNNHNSPSPFLTRYVNTLKKRKNNIQQAVQSFTDFLDAPSSGQSPQMLIYVLKEQNEAIVRCSARISQIQKKSEQVQQKISALFNNRNITESTISNADQGHAEKFSSKTIADDYEKFKKNRIRELEKRETDKSKFVKQQPQQNAFGFGTFGTSTFGTSNFGSSNFGSSNFGASNFGSSNFGATNTSKNSNSNSKSSKS